MITAEPLISVISPSWNQGDFIEECIRSVGKSHDNLEHIIVDNCSTDQTHDVLSKYPHLTVTSEPDEGQSNALNKGFRLAKGEWVLWLNVDDYLEPGCIDFYLSKIQTEGDSFDVMFGHTRFVNENSETIKTVYQPVWRHLYLKYGVCLPPTSGTLFRKKLLIENPLDENYHMIMDSEWFYRNGNNIHLRRIRKTLINFRVGNDNKTSAHIKSGTLTPRHQEERERLFSTYGFRYAPVSLKDLKDGSLTDYLIRKLLRCCVLADKLVSKCKDTLKK